MEGHLVPTISSGEERAETCQGLLAMLRPSVSNHQVTWNAGVASWQACWCPTISAILGIQSLLGFQGLLHAQAFWNLSMAWQHEA